MSQISQVNESGLKPHRGTIILVFGILGLVLCVIFGIVAWVMGNSDLRDMAEGRMNPSGECLTTSGKICGMIACIIAIVAIAITIVWIVIWLVIAVVFVGGAAVSAAL